MHAWDGQVSHVDEGIFSSFFSVDAYPALSLTGLGSRISRPVVIHVLIFTRQKAVIAIFTFLRINDHKPFLHFTPRISVHFSISTRHEFAAMLWDFSMIDRLGVNM